MHCKWMTSGNLAVKINKGQFIRKWSGFGHDPSRITATVSLLRIEPKSLYIDKPLSSIALRCIIPSQTRHW